MLDGLRQFIADVVSPYAERSFDDTGYQLAATALLIHVVSLDGEPTEIEKRKLHGLIESRFGLDRGSADHLIASATLVEGEAVDLYHFTSVIMRLVDEAGRLRIVEMMWELVYADGNVTEFEDNVVWRAADLLGISSRDRLELKHRVALTARRADRLGAIAHEITAAGGKAPILIPCDLQDRDAADKIEAALRAADVEVEYLVNNAGFGLFGKAIELDRGEQLGIID